MTHIIMLWVIFVFLIALYFVIKVCLSQNLISRETDFITDFFVKKLDTLNKNNIPMTITIYIGLVICTPIALGIIVFVFTHNIGLTILIAVAGMMVPDGIIILQKSKADKDFEDRYAKSLEQLASSLKAGLSIIQAVQEVSNNKFIHESIRVRYRTLASELQMGISITDAFYNFANSTNSKDAKDVALAIDIQNHIGGHEAEIIQSIAKGIHNRIMLRRELKSIFAGTSSMVVIMDFLPLTIITFLCLMDSSYIAYYFKDGFHIMIFVILIGMCLLGSFLNHAKMQKIMKGA